MQRLTPTVVHERKKIMAVLGLGTDDKPKTGTKSKKDDDATSAQDEAKALLEKMDAKADADECPFC